ncbi:MAG: nuclear transport factor 2 family protein [Dehalococcoidia bacterium]|nr:nuclear transport factor 2 family protein [Dehalococcoidia bacterium]
MRHGAIADVLGAGLPYRTAPAAPTRRRESAYTGEFRGAFNRRPSGDPTALREVQPRDRFGRWGRLGSLFFARRSIHVASRNVSGSAELEGFAAWYSPLMKARHWTNNLLLEGDDKTAEGSCYLILFRLTPGETPPAGIYATGIYQDTLRKDGAGWSFTSRNATFDS